MPSSLNLVVHKQFHQCLDFRDGLIEQYKLLSELVVKAALVDLLFLHSADFPRKLLYAFVAFLLRILAFLLDLVDFRMTF